MKNETKHHMQWLLLTVCKMNHCFRDMCSVFMISIKRWSQFYHILLFGSFVLYYILSFSLVWNKSRLYLFCNMIFVNTFESVKWQQSDQQIQIHRHREKIHRLEVDDFFFFYNVLEFEKHIQMWLTVNNVNSLCK